MPPALPSDIGNRFPDDFPRIDDRVRPAAALTCRLPGPWHDSQPMSMDCFTVVPFASLPFPPLLFTISVFVLCSRAWVAVRKSRTISSWQVLHSSEPTNSAPGNAGRR